MSSRAGLLLAISVTAISVGAVAFSTFGTERATRARRVAPEPVAALDEASWPAAGATLRAPSTPNAARVIEVVLDPGHGARDNRGNTGSFCVDEQDAMMDLAVGVADRLGASGRFVVHLAREPSDVVEYSERVRAAEASGADAFVSLHSDVRGRVERWSPAAGLDCPIAMDAPGFAVLYSDEGDAALVTHRLGLGRAVARRMLEAGFAAYDGADYLGFYARDAQPGLFVDRHAPERRIFVLRRPSIPSVLIETHNALDPREAARWTDPDTLDAFAGAVSAALSDAYPLRNGPGLD
jgi:N-acetylmuramoyl-L-alanine amidase